MDFKHPPQEALPNMWGGLEIRKMRSVDEYLPLLETLMTFEPPVHVFGEFAEDALLHGTSVGTHQDVDVLVGRQADAPPRIAA
jgi:hypothetical protein